MSAVWVRTDPGETPRLYSLNIVFTTDSLMLFQEGKITYSMEIMSCFPCDYLCLSHVQMANCFDLLVLCLINPYHLCWWVDPLTPTNLTPTGSHNAPCCQLSWSPAILRPSFFILLRTLLRWHFPHEQLSWSRVMLWKSCWKSLISWTCCVQLVCADWASANCPKEYTTIRNLTLLSDGWK